jgi:hypothetical protein
MAHAKIVQDVESSGRKGFEMSSYNTDLWFNYPDVMRRSASESPLSEFRSSSHPHSHTPSSGVSEGVDARKRNDDRKSGTSHNIKHVLNDESVKMRHGTYSLPHVANQG